VAVRRAELSREESAAYLGGLVDLPAWAVERACRYVGSHPRGEYESAMPDLGAIRARALAQIRLEQDRRDSARLLRAPDFEPVPTERIESFMAKIREAIGRKAMP
jgi:hypothetical protein